MELAYFLGRFHVLALHLPISLILVAVVVERLARSPRYQHLGAALSFLWGIAAASAVITAALGYVHYLEGGFDGLDASLHLSFGVGLAAGTVLAWRLRVAAATFGSARDVLSAAVVVLVLVTSYFGGRLTHGATYLTEHMPLPWRQSDGEGVRHAAAGAEPSAVDESVLAALQAAGFQARQVAAGKPKVTASLAHTSDPISDQQIEALRAAGDVVEVLNLRDSSVTDRHLAQLTGLSNLVRLDLRDNALTDDAISSLAAFGKLEYLNLVGNVGITDAALEALAALPSLKRVYLWNTAVTAEAAGARAQRPGPAVDLGVAIAVDYGEPASIAGAWNVDYLDRARRPTQAVMMLEQDGDSVSGTLGQSSVLGSVRGTRVSFYVLTPTAFGKASMDLEGEVAAERMEGATWSAVRAGPP